MHKTTLTLGLLGAALLLSACGNKTALTLPPQPTAAPAKASPAPAQTPSPAPAPADHNSAATPASAK